MLTITDMDLSGIEFILVDISGTLIVGNKPTNGAVEAFNEYAVQINYLSTIVMVRLAG